MAAGKKYVANWRIEGLSAKPLEPGDTVVLDPKDAKPFLAGGSLSEAKTTEKDEKEEEKK